MKEMIKVHKKKRQEREKELQGSRKDEKILTKFYNSSLCRKSVPYGYRPVASSNLVRMTVLRRVNVGAEINILLIRRGRHFCG